MPSHGNFDSAFTDGVGEIWDVSAQDPLWYENPCWWLLRRGFGAFISQAAFKKRRITQTS